MNCTEYWTKDRSLYCTAYEIKKDRVFPIYAHIKRSISKPDISIANNFKVFDQEVDNDNIENCAKVQACHCN
jgi:hypothetical protein